MLNKVLIGLLGAGVIATGGYTAATGLDDSVPARTVSLPGATTNDGTTTGSTTTGGTTTNSTATAAATTDDVVVGNTPAAGVAGATGEDISGPCDEPEHANDSRCTGAGGTTADDDEDDRSGSDQDSGDDRGDSDDDSENDDDDDDDRSGSNSGKG